MPSAKTNTVTFDVADAVKEIKAGRVEFRVDKAGIIHNAVGKASFTADQLFDNVKTLLRAIVKARPAAVKGTYLKGVVLSSTMGSGIKINATTAQKKIAVLADSGTSAASHCLRPAGSSHSPHRPGLQNSTQIGRASCRERV